VGTDEFFYHAIEHALEGKNGCVDCAVREGAGDAECVVGSEAAIARQFEHRAFHRVIAAVTRKASVYSAQQQD
jgi:hypothetical protein